MSDRAFELVDWGLASRLGHAVAGPGPAVDASERRRLSDDFERLVEVADGLVRDFTGFDASSSGGPVVLGRSGWVDANLDGFRRLLRPIAERLSAGSGGLRSLGRMAVGAQVGLLLGYVAQKVLGQYDLLLASGAPGRLYFVGPNVVEAERRWRFEPEDFRLWIALHEVTHRAQFSAIPWLRGHVEGLIERYLSGVQLDAGRLKEVARGVAKVLAGGPSAWRTVDVPTLFLTPGQRETIRQMQSVMSVVEGHGNFVMDRIGASAIRTFASMRDALMRQRSRVSSAERALQKVIGLDMKYEQYSVGEAFFVAVEERAGGQGVSRVWQSVGDLPTTDELRTPAAWFGRMGI